jgi:nitrous oxidase accessory protein
VKRRGARISSVACAMLALVACADTERSPAGNDGERDAPLIRDLAARIAATAAGGTLELPPGRYVGPVVIDKPIRLAGGPDSVIVSSGEGSTIAIKAANVTVTGLRVDGSGGRFDLLDAAVHVTADDVVIENLTIDRALFGVLVERCKRATVRDCDIRGVGGEAMGLRGDGIRLWEATDSLVIGNHVRDCRDCVVWYSSRNRVEKNRVEGCRYGTHFMYSHECTATANELIGNTVGIFVMYSKDVNLTANLIARCSGAAGMGIGFKESGNITVADNRLAANTTGIYIDTSPLNQDHVNRFERNRIEMSDHGIQFHSTPKRNEFTANDFLNNAHHIAVGGQGHARSVPWTDNHFDDYQGYDLDRDGVGDVPYRLESLSSDIISSHPDLAFFRGSPLLALTDLAGHVFPILEPRALLEDHWPRIRPRGEL